MKKMAAHSYTVVAAIMVSPWLGLYLTASATYPKLTSQSWKSNLVWNINDFYTSNGVIKVDLDAGWSVTSNRF